MSYTHYFYPIRYLGIWLSDIAIYLAGQTWNIMDSVGQCFSLIHCSHSQHCANSTSEMHLLPLTSFHCLLPYTSAHDARSPLSNKPPNGSFCKIPLLYTMPSLPLMLITKNRCASFSFSIARWGSSGDGCWWWWHSNMSVCNIHICIFYHNLKMCIYGLVIPKLTSLLCNHDWLLTTCYGRKSKCLCSLTLPILKRPFWPLHSILKHTLILKYASVLHISLKKSFCLQCFLFIYIW